MGRSSIVKPVRGAARDLPSLALLRNPTLQAALLVWALFALLTASDAFSLALFREGWVMSVTMVFGSLVAGATSEGGGAVAFPVMTLLFGIAPPVARDFSLMIQTVGMVAAGWTILRLGIPVERHALVWSSLGGAVGVCLGISVVAPRLSPPAVKLFFVSLWLSFGMALLWVNRLRDRSIETTIRGFDRRHAALLAGTGLAGGCVSGMTGSGIDIVTFSLLSLGLRVCEKVATPTSVILMGVNAAVGFAWRATFAQPGLGPIPDQAWGYWYCCIAIVVLGAPLGARLIAARSREFVVAVLLASILAQFAGAMVIVPKTPALWALVAATFGVGLAGFGAMALLGARRAAGVGAARLLD
jgi:uncharacterized membrane protein YfcA